MPAVQSLGVPNAQPPDVLYKYLPPERIDILEGVEIRFSRPSDFNDDFDSHYLVPSAQGLKGTGARFLFKNRIGIFCLTERADDHVMWVHYAANHTGFILGFDASAHFFRDDGRTLGKVIYQARPNVLPEADVRACFRKSNDWKYEKEWRCVRKFESSEPRMVGLDPALVKEIVFGFRMKPWHITRIMQLVTEYEMNHVKFMISSASKTEWTFQNHPKTMSLCNSCGGNGYLMDDPRPPDV
jgi:hypothetical protein